MDLDASSVHPKNPISSHVARTSLVNKYLLWGKRSLCEPLLLVKDTNIRKLNGLRQSSYSILNEDKTKCVAKINTLKIAFNLDFFLRGNPQDFFERKFRTSPNECLSLKQGCKRLESEDILGRVVRSPVDVKWQHDDYAAQSLSCRAALGKLRNLSWEFMTQIATAGSKVNCVLIASIVETVFLQS